MADKNKMLILAVKAAPYASAGTDVLMIGHGNVIAMLEQDGTNTVLAPRGPLETNEDYRQVIPYIMVRSKTDGRWLCYVRGDDIPEVRLRGKTALGVGGHIDATDVVFDEVTCMVDFEATLSLTSRREMLEEIGVSRVGNKFRWLGLIIDQDTPVSRVHIGTLAVIDVHPDEIVIEPDEIASCQWMTTEEIVSLPVERQEGWTGLVGARLPMIENLLR